MDLDKQGSQGSQGKQGKQGKQGNQRYQGKKGGLLLLLRLTKLANKAKAKQKIIFPQRQRNLKSEMLVLDLNPLYTDPQKQT